MFGSDGAEIGVGDGVGVGVGVEACVGVGVGVGADVGVLLSCATLSAGVATLSPMVGSPQMGHAFDRLDMGLLHFLHLISAMMISLFCNQSVV